MAKKKKKKYLKLKHRRIIQEGLEKNWGLQVIVRKLKNKWPKETMWRKEAIQHEIDTYSVDGKYAALEANKLFKEVKRGTRQNKEKVLTDREFQLRWEVGWFTIVQHLGARMIIRGETEQELEVLITPHLAGVGRGAQYTFGISVGGLTNKQRSENLKKFLGVVSLSPNTIRQWNVSYRADPFNLLKRRRKPTEAEQDIGQHWKEFAPFVCLLRLARKRMAFSRFDLNGLNDFYRKHTYKFDVDLRTVPSFLVPFGYAAANRFRIDGRWRMNLVHCRCRFEKNFLLDAVNNELEAVTEPVYRAFYEKHFVAAFTMTGKNPAGDGVTHLFVDLL